MSWLKRKENVKIIDTGKHLPKTTIDAELRFRMESDRFVRNHILMDAKKDGIIVYGAQAVNEQVGVMHSRPTFDWDVHSPKPIHSGVKLEKAIDNHAQANISHTEVITFTDEKSKTKKMSRVRLKGFDTVADFTPMPKKIKTTIINGVNFETLENAEKKYNKMIFEGETKRLINANEDLTRIHLYKYNKKMW